MSGFSDWPHPVAPVGSWVFALDRVGRVVEHRDGGAVVDDPTDLREPFVSYSHTPLPDRWVWLFRMVQWFADRAELAGQRSRSRIRRATYAINDAARRGEPTPSIGVLVRYRFGLSTRKDDTA